MFGINAALNKMFLKIFSLQVKKSDEKFDIVDLYHDPIEDSVEYKMVIDEVNLEVKRFMQENHKNVLLGPVT